MAQEETVEDCTIDLPEHIIHHILSFFYFPKEAAQKSLLSKAWLRAWRTRPNLNFNGWGYCTENKSTDIQVLEKQRCDFINCINTTLKRYDEHKNGIDILELIRIPSVSTEHVNKWIKIAVDNNVKRLAVDIYTDSSLWPQTISTTESFVLPQTIFLAESLVELSLFGNFQLNPQVIKTITCHNLQKLWLTGVDLDEGMFQTIVLSCPLIDLLKISNCAGFAKLKVTKLQKLKVFEVIFKGGGCVEVEAPSLEFFNYRKIYSFHNEVGMPSGHCRLQMHSSQNLKHLQFEDIDITDELFLDITEKFPHLEDLDIERCNHLRRIKISSHSIRRINLKSNYRLEEAHIDVPSINRFRFIGCSIPLFSFTAPSGSCVSLIEFYWSKWHLPEASWFSKLKDLLTKVGQSEISLQLKCGSTLASSIVDEIRSSALYPIPQVQTLSICFEKGKSFDADLILDAIFWTCRPKTIAQDWNQNPDLNEFQLLKVIFEMLILGGNQKHINLQKTKFWQNDLKDATIVLSDEDYCLGVQLPDTLDWDTFLEVFPPKQYYGYFQYKLEWEAKGKDKYGVN